VPPATLVLCLALVACFGLYHLAEERLQYWALTNFAFVPAWFLLQFEAANGGLSLHGILPLVSHAFLHVDFMHLLLNAGFLLAFGAVVERHFGVLRFVVMFICCAAAGAVFQALVEGPGGPPMIGASGAVYGMLGAAVLLMFRAEVSQRLKRALIFVAVIMGVNLVVGLLSRGGTLMGGEIAWQAHIGGFVAGLALAVLFGAWTRRAHHVF
jgi:membrane associated rhomboid family serine protease